METPPAHGAALDKFAFPNRRGGLRCRLQYGAPWGRGARRVRCSVPGRIEIRAFSAALSRILSRPEIVKGRRGGRKPRWVQVPTWLMEILLEQVPPDDRSPDQPLFPWLHRMQHPRQAAHKTMVNACRTAGIPHFHPHDLRHRRISLSHGQGIPAREIGDRVGQRQISTTLDVYTHVLMSPNEVSEGAYRAALVVSPWCPAPA